MKRLIIITWLALGFGFGVCAAPQQIYVNYGVVTNAPQVDATSFLNEGTISFNTVTVNSNYVYPVGDSAGYNSIPFSPRDTLYYTNTSSGIIAGTNGAIFETVTSTTIHNAASFANDGLITGFDFPAIVDIFSTTAGTTAIPEGSLPVASIVQVLATNILNDGTMAVGNAGALKMTGSNVNLQNGNLIAGAVNTGGGNGVEYDPLDTTGGGTTVNVFGDSAYYVNPPGVYDLYWGTTPVTTPLALDQFFPPISTDVYVGTRQGDGGTFGFGLPLSTNPIWSTNVYTFTLDPSNTYINIAFVNTNFYDVNGQPNPNIQGNVGFTTTRYILNGGGGQTNGDIETLVQFAMPVPDVISGGQIVTNAVYLVDVGGIFAVMTNDDNAASVDGFSRPNAFDVTTTTPQEWLSTVPGNTPYDPTLIYEPGTYSSTDVPYEVASYGVQIGRNPAQLDGSFHFNNFLDSFSGGSFNGVYGDLGLDLVLLPDPTNEPARLELTANQLNLSNARLRAEGMVLINASNIIGHASGADWGQNDSQIGAANGSLVISNVFPTTFQRLRGNIYAWSANWVNTDTNVSPTNTFHYHMLIVDQNLGGNFQSTTRNLNLTGSNSITLQDPMYVINQFAFNTPNLILNSNVVFTQNAGSLMPSNMPHLKSFLININGSLAVDSVLDIGFDSTKTPAPPANRKYAVNSITNLGMITATAPLFQSSAFENDGSITANHNGSMIIEAASIGLGLTPSNGSNYLGADDNITLSANSIGITNSHIVCGGTNSLNKGLLTLQTTAKNSQITDFLSSLASTNAYVTNIWQVTDGFSLLVKPAAGDLFGTEITTIATNTTVALHTWAGADLGASSAGFADNMVIGHLKLSRQSEDAELHFTGAGIRNGLYVDYLDLDTNSLSFSDYRNGMVIDSNLTIYFAACNVDPTKLETTYSNRLVWVPGFAGPNSTLSVPYTNCSTNVQYCPMNVNLAESDEISFFGGVPNADNQPYVLNDPSGATCTNYPCPDNTTMLKDFILLTGGTNEVNVELSTIGDGSISPNLSQKQVAIGRQYTLTATPSNGWVFAGWDVSGLSGAVNTASRVLKFRLENSVVLTANFVPKPFTLVKGTYYGLFAPSNQVAAAGSGWFTFTLHDNGAFSGRLLMGPDNYSFSDKFAEIGTAQMIARHGNQYLTVNLNLDMSNKTGRVWGYVNDTNIVLQGNLTPGWTAKNPSPYAGRYTIIFTNGGATNLSIGDSYGTVIVSKLGELSIAGKLADGKPFSQSVPIAPGGQWPFYAYAPSGEDFLLGWLDFQGNIVNGYNIGQTNVFWSKGSSDKSLYYPAGFSDTFGVMASPYANPGKTGTVLTLTEPAIVLSGDGMVSAVTNFVTYNGKLLYSTNDLTLSINPTVGSFTGRSKNAEGGAATMLNGVVLQNQDGAFGFFLGTNDESGTVLLQSQ